MAFRPAASQASGFELSFETRFITALLFHRSREEVATVGDSEQVYVRCQISISCRDGVLHCDQKQSNTITRVNMLGYLSAY